MSGSWRQPVADDRDPYPLAVAAAPVVTALPGHGISLGRTVWTERAPAPRRCWGVPVPRRCPYRAPRRVIGGTAVARRRVIVFGFRIRNGPRRAGTGRCEEKGCRRGCRGRWRAGVRHRGQARRGAGTRSSRSSAGTTMSTRRCATPSRSGAATTCSTKTRTRSSTWSCCGGGRATAISRTSLIGAIGPLAENGVIWVLTPKTGRGGHVEPSEIAEAALTAGLSQTSNVSVGDTLGGCAAGVRTGGAIAPLTSGSPPQRRR